jgi:predicted MPP superfamily phosphohydrolase
MPEFSWLFHALATATAIGVPLYAWQARGRIYAIFSAVVLAFSLPGSILLHARLCAWLGDPGAAWLSASFAALMAATGIQLAELVTARLRGRLHRILVSIPGQAFLAMGVLSGVWLLLLLPVRVLASAVGWNAALSALSWLDLAPLGLCAGSIVTSMRLRPETVRVRLGQAGPRELQRVPVERHLGRPPRPLDEASLRIVQIADPHLGPWQSVRQLQRTLTVLLQKQPDLVLLTGDFLTMEGRGTPGALASALAPLRSYSGRCYAIFGNHDHEDPDEVRHALAANEIDLLMDEERLLDTPVGPLQLIGADYRGRDREQHIQELLARFPRREDRLRLLLLHDPLGFQHIPAGNVDLTLSGHTHGGQVGLVSMGLDWTVLSGSRWPDHGLFARGTGRLYVHRGTGFYGFPLRIGVPGEASVLELLPNPG